MKKALLTLLSPFALTSLFAQTYCGTSRFDTEMFPSVTTTSNVVYGWNTNVNNGTDTLKMDIYQPSGDVAPMRPLIIFAHGGSFIGGSKTDADEVTLATRFAKRGYVTASINYRLGMGFPINQANAQKAVWRATQDMKAAVRFFRKDASTTNTYKIDPSFVFVGGYSAGAFMAVNYAYMDQPAEIPIAIDTTILGGMEGNSGNPGYSTAINAVLNFAGAVGDTAWMHAGDEPMVTAQGDVDGTVPYCTAMIYVSGFPIMVVSGGGTMHIRCFNQGIENPIHTYYGQDHPADVSSANMDTTIGIASDFVYKHLGCTPSGNPQVYINNQTCVSGATGIANATMNSENISVYPNPSSGEFIVNGLPLTGEIKIYNMFGQKVFESRINNNQEAINFNSASGIYSLKIISEGKETYTTKLVLTEK